MPYTRRSRRFARLRPVQSDKHEITWSQLGQNASSVQTIDFVVGTQDADKNTSTEVEIGSKVYGIYIEFNLSSATTAAANVFHWKVEYVFPGQATSNPNVYYQTDRRQTIKRGMEMNVTNVSTVVKRILFVRIPKFMSRIGDSNKIRLKYITSGTDTINFCGFAVYKEFK